METFITLDDESQKRLIEKMLRVVNKTSLSVEFESENERVMHKFMLKRWPYMSISFFQRSLKRWDILKNTSYGGANISSCEVGDLYLHAKPWRDHGYRDHPFKTDDHRNLYFYNIIPNEGNWDEMYISRLVGDDLPPEHIFITTLLELQDDLFEHTLKEFHFDGNLEPYEEEKDDDIMHYVMHYE